MKKIMLAALAAVCVSTSSSAYTGVSDWAKAEVEKAEKYALIPASLADAELSKPITRSEFAGLSVKHFQAKALSFRKKTLLTTLPTARF